MTLKCVHKYFVTILSIHIVFNFLMTTENQNCLCQKNDKFFIIIKILRIFYL